MFIHEVMNAIWIFITFDGMFVLYLKYFVKENLMVEIITLKNDVVLS